MIIPVYLFETAAIDIGFSMKDISEDDKPAVLDSLKLVNINEDVKLSNITCFDVNDDGLIAIGSDGFSDTKKIIVTDNEGDYKYGYEFCSPEKFGVNWDGDNVVITLVRSSIAVSFDQNAKCVDIQEIERTNKNDSIWNNSVFVNKRFIGNDEYVMETDFILSSGYSRLVRISEIGERKIIYDVVSLVNIKSLCFFVCFIVVLVLVVLFAVFRKTSGNSR